MMLNKCIIQWFWVNVTPKAHRFWEFFFLFFPLKNVMKFLLLADLCTLQLHSSVNCTQRVLFSFNFFLIFSGKENWSFLHSIHVPWVQGKKSNAFSLHICPDLFRHWLLSPFNLYFFIKLGPSAEKIRQKCYKCYKLIQRFRVTGLFTGH